MPASEMIERVDRLIMMREPTAPPEVAKALASLRARLREPVRIAVIGRVKAGKSTMVNALLGQQVAPTDVSECTRVVTWFHYGHPQRLVIELRDGSRREEQLSTTATLPEELGVPIDSVAVLHVYLANETLRSMTLIDTPGIGSVHSEFSQATEELLVSARDSASATEHADAVVFLLNQVMMEDELRTLQMFKDAGADGSGSAANAVGLLSRADQIGDGTRDPWQVALELADHFAGTFRSEVATVVPVIGLLAEAAEAATLTETDVRALRALAELEPAQLRRITWSPDQFVTADAPISEADRERLLVILDLYGVVRAVEILRDGVDGAVALRKQLSKASGISEVKRTISAYFRDQDHVLKVRSVLDALTRLSYLGTDAPPDPTLTRLRTDVEALRMDPQMHPVSELEAWHDCCTGRVQMSDKERAELARLFAPGPPRTRLGCAADDDPVPIAREAMLRWRAFMNTDADPGQARVARVVLRSYQLLWQEAQSGG